MSHHVYNTNGIVIGLYPAKEADKTALIFTRELGLVYGRARGIRKSNSRLSTSLTELSIVKVSLVKGRNLWRITTVTLLTNLFTELRERREALKALNRLTLLLKVLIKGEEKNVELYDEIESSFLALKSGKIKDGEIKSWEVLSVAKVLSHLGYLSKNDAPSSLEDVEKNKKKYIALVNSGIKESGLK